MGNTSYLAVGVPDEDIGRAANAGMVQLFTSTGAPTGTVRAGVGLSQHTAGVSGVAEAGDRFGARLAFSPSTPRDRVTRLAVGVPTEDAAATNSGIVQVFPVTDVDAERTWSQDSSGVPGTAEAGDGFGSSLAVVTGPTENALLVGVPDDVVNPSGMVDVLPLATGTALPGSRGRRVSPAGGSRFGASLASAGH